MRVETLGAGAPEVVVAGAVHGDEPCGAEAIDRFLAEDHDITQAVKFIIVNEPALEQDVRYVDTDVNRALPGDPDSDLYEERLAHDFFSEVAGCTGLGIHSTVSYDRPFGAVSNLDPRKRATFRALRHVENVMDTTRVSNGRRCVDLPWFVDIEAGEQHSAAAIDYAYDCILDFLRFTGVLPGEADETPITVYDVFDTVAKAPDADYEVRGRNFERVAPGEVYATRDGDELVADREFWPMLMSSDGHEELLGYRGLPHNRPS